jgi:putative tryptophan/tyrosine transport system substrate-binding protein
MAIRIGRRQFISALGGATAAWPLAVRAQQPSGMRRLGVLMSNLANDPEGRARAAALMQGLGTLNWKDGGDLRIDWRWAGGDFALFEQYAAELVALGPDVLLAGSSSVAVEALRRHTSTIPIVFTGISDPIGQGFVANLARPGGTVTGLSSFDPPIAGKWLEMLTQITPPVARVAVLFNPATAPYAGLYVRAIEEAAPSFAVTMRAAPCHDDAEIEAMIAGLAREGRGGLIALPDPFILVHREAIVGIAGRHSVPAVYPFRHLPPSSQLCRSHPQGREAGRLTGPSADEVRAGDKPQDRQGSRHHHRDVASRHRRRGDRMILSQRIN